MNWNEYFYFFERWEKFINKVFKYDLFIYYRERFIIKRVNIKSIIKRNEY